MTGFQMIPLSLQQWLYATVPMAAEIGLDGQGHPSHFISLG